MYAVNSHMSTMIVAFASHKGGVGKSTIATGFAALTASAKRRTLLIDLDQQGHATFGIGGEVVIRTGQDITNHPGSADFLLGKGLPFQAITPYLHVLAGNNDLNDREIPTLEAEALFDAIATVRDQYDVIVIDTPPNAHDLAKLGTVAAQSVYIPIDAHPYSINSATRLIADLEQRKAKGRIGATRWAIVPNRIDPRRRLDREVMAAAKDVFKDTPILKIAQDTILAQASTDRKPITAYTSNRSRKSSSSKGASVFTELNALVKWADSANK